MNQSQIDQIGNFTRGSMTTSFSGDDTIPNEHESYDDPMNCLGFWVLGPVQYGKKSNIIHIKRLMHNTTWTV